ncbi:MAG: arsenite methyltransferase [bacterium]|nr:arsenite methyltransferase [bacterium]
MQMLQQDKIREAVRETYAEAAQAGTGCGCGCGEPGNPTPEDVSLGLGYSSADVSTVPKGANMGLGCGNPQVIASLQLGETVIDLGSGGGFDCFLAAKAVGDTGQVIGVDMTPEMIAKARANAEKAGVANVDFRLGEIEHLPVADNSTDVIISNCVINLSPEKPNVFKEAFRVLKSGGRVAVSDIVATAELPEDIKHDLALHSACVAGASSIDDVEEMLEDAGFNEIRISPKNDSSAIIRDYAPGRKLEDFIVSANIEAVKP